MTSIISPILPPLPFPLNSGVSLFFGLHMAWRWKTEALEIYRNRTSYLSGKCFNYLASYTPILGQSVYPLAKATLIGRHFLELQSQYDKTLQSYNDVVKTLLFQRSYDVKMTWQNGTFTDDFFGAATNRWLHIQVIKVVKTPLQLLRDSFKLIGNMFLLSHHAVRVLESLRWNAETVNNESLEKFFININVVRDHHKEVSKNQKVLVEQLKKVQPFLSKRFLSKKLTNHLLFVIETLDRGADRAQEIAETVEDLTAIAKDSSLMVAQVSKEVGKSFVNMGSQLFFGCPTFCDPLEFVPPPTYRSTIFDPTTIKLKSVQ